MVTFTNRLVYVILVQVLAPTISIVSADNILPLLCAALGSVMVLVHGRQEETKGGHIKFLLLLGFNLPSPDSSALIPLPIICVRREVDSSGQTARSG